MKIIDIHRHLWDTDWFPPYHRMYSARMAAKRTFPERDPMEILPRVGRGVYDPDGTRMIQQMDDLGIDVSIVMVLDWGMAWKARGEADSPMPIQEINRHVLALKDTYPGSVYGFCSFDPRRKESLRLFETAVKEWGAIGLKVYPPCGFYADDDIMIPFYEKACELGVAVLIHCGGSGMDLLSKYAGPEPIGHVAQLFPDLKVIMGHTNLQMRFESGAYWEGLAAAAAGGNNVYLDLTDWQVQGVLEERNIARFFHVLDLMRNSAGAHRILWGTDLPMGGKAYELTRQWVDLFKSLPEKAAAYNVTFSEDETAMICHGNAERILGIAVPVAS